MALVFPPQPPLLGPQTHVLIIGVGRYRHLRGGAGPVTAGVPPLGQLVSPPVSARALADWFTSRKHDNPTAPLGSVELVLSDSKGQMYVPSGGGDPIPIEDATMQNIEVAFNAWHDRCNAHEANVAIFYFCGHGLQKDVTVLLPENFAQNPNSKWKEAIDFDRSYRGMASCLARTQYYVVDACREWTSSMLQDLDVGGQTLKDSIVSKQRQRTAPKLFATANTLPAFGDTGGVSRVTSALIECLNGGAADKQSGKWVIDTNHLGESVRKLVAQQNLKRPREEWQLVDPAGGEHAVGPQILHVLAADVVPEVWVSFCCEPDAATDKAHFYGQRNGEEARAPAPGRWSSVFRAGSYKFGAQFTGKEYKEATMSDEFIRPPVWPVALPTSKL